jgi:hypothetical protein
VTKNNDDGAEAARFHYGAEAELFTIGNRRFKQGRMGYRRFARMSDAVRFAIEELPPEVLVGAYLQVNEVRFDSGGIRRLYDSPDYPLVRRSAGAV